MLDIHPAQHAASTWREFFIHIATIVLGLMIAVSLEQMVEYIHHRHERRQLEEDLRAEAERRIPILTAGLRQFAILADWYREGLQRGRVATVSGGFVTFVLPDRPQIPTLLRPEDAAWPAERRRASLRCCRTRRSRDGTGSMSPPRRRCGTMMTGPKPARISAPLPTVSESRLLPALRCASLPRSATN